MYIYIQYFHGDSIGNAFDISAREAFNGLASVGLHIQEQLQGAWSSSPLHFNWGNVGDVVGVGDDGDVGDVDDVDDVDGVDDGDDGDAADDDDDDACSFCLRM